MSRPPTAGIVVVEFLFGEILNECVQTFIHPAPLALIAVDDHGEEVVPHFMDDYANHTIFNRFRIRSVLFRTAIVEADHWVFHPTAGLDALRHRIRIIDGVLAVGFDGVGHHFG